MPVPPVNAEEIGYAVLLIRSTDGSTFYASRNGIPGFFMRRREAVAFRDELRPHLKQKGRVVKVRVRFTLSAC
jgi:hypothetical protein